MGDVSYYYVVDAAMGLPWDVAEAAEGMRVRTVASCPTRDAAEAARRLLSGECARAKEEPPVCAWCNVKTVHTMRLRPSSNMFPASECLRRYNEGVADGAAQERARIVAFAKTYVKSPIRAEVLAEMIERGEAG